MKRIHEGLSDPVGYGAQPWKDVETPRAWAGLGAPAAKDLR